MNRRSLLNLGCGPHPHPAFDNIDIVEAPGVIVHDLRTGIPAPDRTYDLVYHSTMLSHLRAADASHLMRECYRVLKPGGILRVVTEDLEQMCRVYLEKLEAASAGDTESSKDYEWMLLELYDQTTREYSGGGMAEYVSQDPLTNEEFIYSRVGEQGRWMVAGARSRKNRPHAARAETRPTTVRARVSKVVLTTLLGSDGLRALEVGRFRMSSGQVSYRMYDRYSLKKLFLDAGFTDIQRRTAIESGYPLWATVNLDLTENGDVARPHALILEGVRSIDSRIDAR